MMARVLVIAQMTDFLVLPVLCALLPAVNMLT